MFSSLLLLSPLAFSLFASSLLFLRSIKKFFICFFKRNSSPFCILYSLQSNASNLLICSKEWRSSCNLSYAYSIFTTFEEFRFICYSKYSRRSFKVFFNDACIKLLCDFDDEFSFAIVDRLLIVIDFENNEDSS